MKLTKLLYYIMKLTKLLCAIEKLTKLLYYRASSYFVVIVLLIINKVMAVFANSNTDLKRFQISYANMAVINGTRLELDRTNLEFKQKVL